MFAPLGYRFEPMKTVEQELLEDIKGRATLGEKRYGVKLHPFNGRDGLIDLYEELLDALYYTKQLLMEREMESKIKRIRKTVTVKKKKRWPF